MTIKPVFFAVASDESISPAFSRQRLLNLFPETSPTKAKSPVAIIGRAGLKPFGTAGLGEIRGASDMANVAYFVSGASLYSIASNGTATLIGSGGEIADSGPVIISNNGTQLAIATGNAWVDYIDGFFLWGRNVTGHAYLYDSSGPTFAAIGDTDLFLTGGGKFQISAALDGTTYDALDFATAESSPDDLIRGYVDRADILLFGTDTTEVWFDSGNADFPFERRNQTVIPKGLIGKNMVTSIDNSAFFVGRDGKAGGSAIVYRLAGFEPQRVSTHAVENALASVTDWSACSCIGYILNGHAFMAIILDTATTWVYDCATQQWHEESTYGLSRWWGNCHCYAYGKHLIGSGTTNEIFQLDLTYHFDGASTQLYWEAVSAPIGDESRWKTMAFFQLDMEAGRSLASGQGANAVVDMCYSDDRGETFGNVRSRSAGLIGQYGKNIIWRQLGRFTSRVIKLSGSDPVKTVLLNYFADII